MRFCRLIVFSSFLIFASLSANAQYTSKSSASGFTSKTPAAQVKPTNPYAAPASSETGTNTYTNNAAKTNTFTTGTGANARPAPTIQIRPTAPSAAMAFRPKEKITETAGAEDTGDDLPTFDAIEGGSSANKEQQKQLVQMPEEPKGEILIYISDFVINDLAEPIMCNWKINVQNNTDLPIQNLRFYYKLVDMETFISIKNISSGATREVKQADFTSKCSAMKQTRLKTIDLKKCKIGDVLNQGCMKYIKFK